MQTRNENAVELVSSWQDLLFVEDMRVICGQNVPGHGVANSISLENTAHPRKPTEICSRYGIKVNFGSDHTFRIVRTIYQNMP